MNNEQANKQPGGPRRGLCAVGWSRLSHPSAFGAKDRGFHLRQGSGGQVSGGRTRAHHQLNRAAGLMFPIVSVVSVGLS
jgi:hypothetical protein